MCNICKKAVEELTQCDNCSELVCESCCEDQSGGGPEATFRLCSECIKEMSQCEGCLRDVPKEYMNLCPKCNLSFCDDCIVSHSSTE
jgi:hypothetical protein